MRLASELARRGHEAMVFTREPATTNPEVADVRVRALPGRTPLSIALRAAREIDGRSFSHVILEYTPQMWGATLYGSPALPAPGGAAPWARASRDRNHARARDALVPETGSRGRRRHDARSISRALAARSSALRHDRDATRDGPALARRPLPRPPPGCDADRPETHSRRRRPPSLGGTAWGCSRPSPSASPSTSSSPPSKRFAARYPDAELVLLGDLGAPGNPRLTALQSRMARSPVRARIQVTGKLELRDVAASVGSLDAYLFPMTTGANTRSGTLPVALGTGVPVIAVRGPETDALFEHRRNILFADDFTGPAFAQAALELFADPTLAGRLSEGGRALYQEALSWERTATMLLEAIDRDEVRKR